MARPSVNDRSNLLRVDGFQFALGWPRYRPTTSERIINGVLFFYSALIGAIAAFIVAGMHDVLLTPVAFIVVFLELPSWLARQFSREGTALPAATWFSRTPFLLIWLFTVALPFAASQMHSGLGQLMLFLAPVLMVSHLANRITGHYLEYLASHHALSPKTQEKWSNAFARLWRGFPFVEPARDDMNEVERKTFYRATRAFANYRFRLFTAWFVPIAIAALYLLEPASNRYVPLPGAFAVAGALLALLSGVQSRSILATWNALQAFVATPVSVPEHELSPWAPVSSAGTTDIRRKRVVQTVILSVACFSSLTIEAFAGQNCISEFLSQIPSGNVSLPIACASMALAVGLFSLLFGPLVLNYISGPTFLYAQELLDDGCN